MRKRFLTAVVFQIINLVCIASPNVQILPLSEIPLVFGGTDGSVEMVFENTSDQTVQSNIRTRLYQLNSATVVPLGVANDWKILELLPRQKVLEKMAIRFPEVRAVTTFRIQWLDENEKQIGITPVRVFPRGLLVQLAAFAEKKPIGVLDPENGLKPLLKNNKVAFEDLEMSSGFDAFEGKLIIIGPFRSKNSVPPNLREQIIDATKRTKAPLSVVWIQPTGAAADPLLPIYLVRENKTVVAVVAAEAVGDLDTSPGAQMNLVRAAQLALAPDFRLPQIEP